MSRERHHKHPPLKRAMRGNYHLLEWAIYGTTCGEIEAFYNTIAAHFKTKFRLSYIDADHSEKPKATLLQVGEKKYFQNHIFEANHFDDKFNIALSQAVFINGNHYPGQRQIVIINPKKKDSLQRRVEQLDCIDLLILPDKETELFDFLKGKVDEHTRYFYQDQMPEILFFLEEAIIQSLPTVKALILAGGKSTRMQEDKSKLKYHGDLTQEAYLGKMCQNLGLETYISKSAKEEQNEIESIEVLKDRYLELGPFGAILSAFMKDPDAAWLVLACDLPYISEQNIQHLIQERSTMHFATAFRVKEQPFPEPLIAIYEPAIYKRMLEFLSLGYACPRKVLINSEVKHVVLDNEKIAFNANTPSDKASVLKELNTKN